MDSNLPFKAEYAKTSRASCKTCKNSIDQGTLRIAVIVQSAFHDGKQPLWHHKNCFFKKQRPGSVGDIENFASLRYEDQEELKKTIGELGSVVLPSGKGKGTKRSKQDNALLKDFGIEYSKSGRAACKGCELKIQKDEVRIRKTVFDTEIGMKYGGQPLWHHVDCFAQVRGELGWLETGEKLPGFKDLKKEDQANIRKLLPAMQPEDAPDSKKLKLEPKDEVDAAEDKKLEEKIKQQMKRFFKFRDAAKEEMKKNHIMQLLENNNQTPILGDSEKLLDQVADMLTFGALLPCSQCKNGTFVFNQSGFICTGALTEWTKCANLVKEPPRKVCKISSDLKSTYAFLKGVKKSVEVRAIRCILPSVSTFSKSVKKEDELDGPKIKREKPPLYNLQFSAIGLKDLVEELKTTIVKMGGKFDTKISEKTIAVFSTPEEVEKLTSRMKKAQDLGIHVIPFDYLKDVEKDRAGAISYIVSKSICDWGTDPQARVPKEEQKSSQSKSIYTKSVPKSMKLKVKGGLAVDPDSGLEDVAHVFVHNKTKYNIVLGLTDIQRNKNSYYKLQVLESDNKNQYWLFRSWGRIGTTIGGSKVEKFNTSYDAIEVFKQLYEEKSGNDFEDRQHFVKMPGLMYPIDIDYGDDQKVDLTVEHKAKSKLSDPVQDLIKLMFDVNAMKKVMLEFDLDMEKMPLGKLSQKQIQSAYKVLTDISELIQKGGNNNQFIDATNRFYTLIPHSFGVDNPPILDTTEQIKNLSDMLDNLLEIECAYSMLQSEDVNADVNPIDQHYEQLKTELVVIDKNSDEYKTLVKYVQNTHGETHKMYDLEVIDIFKVSRKGEARRYKPFKKLHNRKLLWHGSRLTNYAGILSHGLKIAPPEAPVTGYMFGKGIYFADMVSKSANYCCTSKQNSTGLMLLSEVALGDMLECHQADYITKLPSHKHSAWGKGRTQPNPKESIVREDGVEIPLGKPVTNSKIATSLLYNEFIVYDVAQVNIQYLLKMDFKYKY